jgi:hypothetical protein
MSSERLEKNQRGYAHPAARQLRPEAVDDPAVVRVQQAAQELPRMAIADLALPRVELDPAIVLVPGTVLRARPRPQRTAADDADAAVHPIGLQLTRRARSVSIIAVQQSSMIAGYAASRATTS